MRLSAAPDRHHARGAGLVEVLVSLALLALGVLGMMASHSASLRYIAMSQQRNTAQWLLQDMSERVRANLGRRTADEAFLLLYTAEVLTWQVQAAVPAAAQTLCDTTGVCEVAEMARFDLAQWRMAVRARLPQGAVHLARAEASTLSLTVAWRELADNAAGLAGSDACPAGLAVNPAEVRCVVWQVSL